MKKKFKELPSQKYLKECFTYDPEIGKLYWKHRPREHFKDLRAYHIFNSRFEGQFALNALASHGYYKGTLDYKDVLAHRVIWKLVYGEDPEEILHENGNRSDNRIEKLSNGTPRDNMMDRKIGHNNTSGVIGVSWHKAQGKWRAVIGSGKTKKHLGYFSTLTAAAEARKIAEKESGYHENHGRDN